MVRYIYIYIYIYISLEFELLSHMVSLFLVVWGTVRLFSKAVLPFYILTSSKLVLWFFYILADTCWYLNFWSYYLWGGIPLCLVLHSPDNLGCEYLFIYLFSICVIFLGEINVYSDLCPFWNWVVFISELLEFFIYSRFKFLMTCKCFPQFKIFTFLMVSFETQKF